MVDQVGGQHYQKYGATGEQHWDRAWRLGLNYWQAASTKYVERYKDKNPDNREKQLEDLEKAVSYIQKLAQLEFPDLLAARPRNEAAGETWVRDLLAKHLGYDGPLTPGACPLAEWLEELCTLRGIVSDQVASATSAYVDQDRAPYPGVKPLMEVVDKNTVASTWQVLAWRHFTYEGGNAIHDYFRCKACREHITIPRGHNPHTSHSCATDTSATT